MPPADTNAGLDRRISVGRGLPEAVTPTAADDLFEGVVLVKCWVAGSPFWVRVVLISLSALGCADDRFQLSRLLMSLWGRQAARSPWSLPGQVGSKICAAGLNGCWRARTCQLAIRTLRATALLAGFALPCRVLVWV
jgi:hypothetical protein